MTEKSRRYIWGPLLLGLLVLAVDILSKIWTDATLPRMSDSSPLYPYGGIAVFENFMGVEFSITHTINKGAAWGLAAQYQMPLLYFRIVLIGALGWYFFFYNQKKELRFPLALILAGAIGNVIDYFIYGHVVDMFHFVLWGYDFPVFNVADSAICIGMLWILLFSSH